MRKTVSILLLAAGAYFAADSALAVTAEDVFGDWVHPDNGSVIRIYPCANTICGKIVYVRDRSRRDIRNPNVRLRNRPIIGIVIAAHAKRSGSKSWRGNLYNTLNGHVYRGTINLIGENSITLVGCLSGTIFCEAKTLHRVQSPEARAVNGMPPAAPRNMRISKY